MTDTRKPTAVPASPSAPAAGPPDDAYHPDAVEAKWQARWAERRSNEPDLERAERPFYNLMMFPYPSAEGLHVGNMFAFTGADVYGRFKRLQGHDVFEPMGFDAFGIHSENYAIKQGINPAILIPQNIENFRRQLRRIGGMFDWRHELSTTDPRYYKWTQWIFLQLFKAGKAYGKAAAVNWCPKDKTVLANEQVIDGRCERCGSVVEQRILEQWFFRITEYADRLLNDLDDKTKMDWSDSTTTAQRNWLGRSEGAEIVFPLEGAVDQADGEGEGEGTGIRVYTTRRTRSSARRSWCWRRSTRWWRRSRPAGSAGRSRRTARRRRRRTWSPARWATGRRQVCSPAATRSTRRRTRGSRSGSRTTY